MCVWNNRIFFLLLLFHLIACAVSICYYPDGSISPQDLPCSDNSDASTCCGPGYACLSNNICMATGLVPEVQGVTISKYTRGSCTDKAWRSVNCPSFCVNDKKPNFDLTSGGMGMAKCENNTSADVYYCIDQNTPNVNCDGLQNVVQFFSREVCSRALERDRLTC